LGLKLILDFVPNHLGVDHSWCMKRPDLFVQSKIPIPGFTFAVETAAGPRLLSHGKDPHFPPWGDTVQVDYRRADARDAMRDLLQGQFTGAPHHFPVQMGRRPVDKPNAAIVELYEKMLATLRASAVGQGEGKLLRPRAAWEGNPTAGNFIVVFWQVRPLEF